MSLRDLHRSIQALIADHDLKAAKPYIAHPKALDVPVIVELHDVELLEIFADAIEKPVVSGDGETFEVAYEVDGVPTIWRARRSVELEAVPTC